MSETTGENDREYHRITICNRAYTKWYFTHMSTQEVILSDDTRVSHISPSQMKLFSGDVVRVSGATATLVYSPIREASYIAGILVLETNRTYGRTANKKRLFYKCIPHNIQYPSFLVPYETTLGFFKNISNKYVLFRFDSWNDARPYIHEVETTPAKTLTTTCSYVAAFRGSYAHGLLTEVIGDVSNPDMYHKYQLYCRNLHHSAAPLIGKVRESIARAPVPQIIASICANPVFQIDNMTGETRPWIFSIDPDGSTDLDDAFSISRRGCGWVVSVYIANVFVWMETLGLWNIPNARISTIYLPEKKIPMLPPMLSDTLCSLLENEPRFACVMDVEIAQDGTLLPETACFRNAMVRVSKNYRYESPDLLADTKYSELRDITRLADPNVRDSHDVVSFWMVQMNTICGARMARRKSGVFRAMSIAKDADDLRKDAGAKNDLSDSARAFFRHWKNTNCLYTENDLFHAGMGVHA
jgi:hypothetical protein